MRLNLGSGPFRAGSWINLDVGLHWNPDVACDLRRLPFADGSVTQVYAGHVLEHLEWDDAKAAVAEIRRVLEPGGRLAVVGPCYWRAIFFGYPQKVLDDIRSGGIEDGTDWMRHKWFPTTKATLGLVHTSFPDAEETELEALRFGWPVVSFIDWQCAVLAQRGQDD